MNIFKGPTAANLNIGGRLREIRTSVGYTQPKVAAMLDISDKTYKMYELGQRSMPIVTALLFCERFGISIEWLATGTGPRGSDTDGEITKTVAKEVLLALKEQGADANPEWTAECIAFVRGEVLEYGISVEEGLTKAMKLLPQ